MDSVPATKVESPSETVSMTDTPSAKQEDSVQSGSATPAQTPSEPATVKSEYAAAPTTEFAPQPGPSVRRSARQPVVAQSPATHSATPIKTSKRSANSKALKYVPVDDSKLCLHLPEADEQVSDSFRAIPSSRISPGQTQSALGTNDLRFQALNSFVRLETCTYQNRNIGLAKTQEDNFTCECKFDPASVALDPSHHACGEESGCINRLTQVECDPSECRTKHLCQNQRSVSFVTRAVAVYAQADSITNHRKDTTS